MSFSTTQKFSRAFFPKVVDLPLNQDSSARFIPWIIGVMLYLALLLGFCATVFFQEMHSRATFEMPQLTVEMVPPAKDRKVVEQSVKTLLESLPGIRGLRLISTQEIRNAFTDFFHEDMPALADMDLEPLLIDVWVQEGYAPKVAKEINGKLSSITSDVQVLLHQSWTRPLLNWMEWLRWGAVLGVVLLIMGLLAVVAFAVRTGLSIHAPILDVLDLMGASERYIVRQFQRQNLRNFFKSFVIMVVFFALTILGMQVFSEVFSERDLLQLNNVFLFSGGALGGVVFCIFFIFLMTQQVVRNSLRRTLIPDV